MKQKQGTPDSGTSTRGHRGVWWWAAGLILFGAATAQAGGVTKVKICHIPPGNPANWHTITVGEPAVPAHLAHGDLLGSCFANCETLCDDGDACTIDACDPDTEQCLVDHPPVDCDDSLYCTVDSCDSASGCGYTPLDCSDGNLCTVDVCNELNDTCESTDQDCGVGGTCDSTTGECVEDPCASVICEPLDQCHVAGTCTDGICDDPIAADGTPCNDGDANTTDDVCTNGDCAGTPTGGGGPCDPNPCNGGTCTVVPGPFPGTEAPLCSDCPSGCSGTYCEMGPGCGPGGGG